MSKYKGIDQRQIKCSDDSQTTVEGGISFDTNADGQNILRFHYLENIVLHNGTLRRKMLHQNSKSMWLNKKNTKELIQILKGLKFKN